MRKLGFFFAPSLRAVCRVGEFGVAGVDGALAWVWILWALGPLVEEAPNQRVKEKAEETVLGQESREVVVLFVCHVFAVILSLGG